MQTIKCHVRIEGGHLLSAKNAHCIVARSTRATDRMGNQLPSSAVADPTPHFQSWRLVKHPKKGFAFVEVRNGSGLGGWSQTVREAVMKASGGLFGPKPDLVIEVFPEGLQAPPALPEHRYKGAPDYKDWYDGAKWCVAKATSLEVAA